MSKPTKEQVFVIPSYPHKWWEREEVEEGALVVLAWPDGDGRIWRVKSIWDEGVEVVQERGYRVVDQSPAEVA